MAVYAVGDVQGCYDDLSRLLDELRFDPSVDRVWFTGDLVNKGPASAQVLRLIRGLGDRAVTVLGNHDLAFLADHYGFIETGSTPTYTDLLRAPDREELVDWLRRQPMLHYDAALETTLVHAGLAPQWDLETARACAAELEQVLRSEAHTVFLRHMFGDLPRRWSSALSDQNRLRFITNALTRMRFCTLEGDLKFGCSGVLDAQPVGSVPWFRVPGRRWQGARVVFGHWAMLGVHSESGVYGLDSGCVYGRRLTALRLDGVPGYSSVPCQGC